MRKIIEINGKKYKPAEMTFNNIVKLEDMGVSLLNADTHSMALIRAYVALCLDTNVANAGIEIEQHVINGGNVESIAECLSEAVEESGFFQALNKKAKEAHTEAQKVED